MIRKPMLWIAVLVAMTAIAGCGGKKATDRMMAHGPMISVREHIRPQTRRR